jgi:hypothetical protein
VDYELFLFNYSLTVTFRCQSILHLEPEQGSKMTQSMNKMMTASGCTFPVKELHVAVDGGPSDLLIGFLIMQNCFSAAPQARRLAAA